MLRLVRRRPFVLGMLLLLLVTVGGIATVPAARLALVNVPSQWFEGRIVTDMVFDEATGLALDLYIPAGAPDRDGWPVIVFLHGGSWQTGDKEDYRFMGTALAQRGYLVVVPDYRKFPAVRFPAFVEDAAATLAWIAADIAGHGGDPERIFLSGHSAGAHTAALLISDERYLDARGLATDSVKGFVGLAGPYDFIPKDPDLVAIFGPPARYPLMQTSRFIDGDEPPMLLLYGLADRTVGPINLERMEKALQDRGNCFEVIRYPDIDHIAIVSAFTWIYRDRRPMIGDMLDFFDRAANGSPCSE